MSNLQIQLFDLNPGDGIAPSISFSVGPLANLGLASASWNLLAAADSDSGSFTSNTTSWLPGAAQAVTAFATATASLNGDGTSVGSTWTASGQAGSPGDALYAPDAVSAVPPLAQFSATVGAPSEFRGAFSLSPFTVAVFSATVAVGATAMEGGLLTDPWGVATDFSSFASASASLTAFGGAAGGGSGFQQSVEVLGVQVVSTFNPWTGLWVNASSSDSGVIAVSFTNLTAMPMNGVLNAVVDVSGSAYGSAAPIPEPGTWALLLAGLAVVGRVAARRR